MKTRNILPLFLAACLLLSVFAPAFGSAEEETVTLRVCNWEEYIDLGDWDPEEETIDLESGDILGENSLVQDFEEWYHETFGVRVKVEYSTFGTNEDLYNMLTIGDVYDLVCPSEYMIMKLMSEDKVQPLSEEFFDPEKETNYYIKGVSPYIRNIFETHEINGVTWDRCAAGYMWGITGFVYNPEKVSEEDASTWKLLENRDYNRQITMKDNVRDAYFAAVGALKGEKLISEEFRDGENYTAELQDEMNDVSPETVNRVQDYLQGIKDNLYSFETDSGKADMITGKVVANYQWSGDAVYAMDQAEEDEYYLNFAVPQESTNIYFDGWIMLKSGIGEDRAKQQAAEAFINFLSRPDNVIRNMYYIGYIFTGDPEDEDYVLTVPEEQIGRQLSAQYPSQDVIQRASIMVYFNEAQSELINRMWIRVRCFNIHSVPVWFWIVLGALVILGIFFGIQRKIAKERLYS